MLQVADASQRRSVGAVSSPVVTRWQRLAARFLSPERPHLGVVRRAVTDVLFGLPAESVRRFESSGVMYFDLASPDVQARAAHEAWEVAVSRLDLDWISHENRYFHDLVVDTHRSRDGARVRIHARGAGGVVEVREVAEDQLIAATDPVAFLRRVSSTPLHLAHPPTLSDVVALVSAAPSVRKAEHLAHEALHRMETGGSRSATPRVVWRTAPRATLQKSKGTLGAVFRAGGAEAEEWLTAMRASMTVRGGRANPFDAILSIYEAGMVLESIGDDEIRLVCPTAE